MVKYEMPQQNGEGLFKTASCFTRTTIIFPTYQSIRDRVNHNERQRSDYAAHVIARHDRSRINAGSIDQQPPPEKELQKDVLSNMAFRPSFLTHQKTRDYRNNGVPFVAAFEPDAGRNVDIFETVGHSADAGVF